MEIQAQAFFPTPVWTAILDGHEALNEQVLRAVRELQARDTQGVVNTNVNGWQSPNTIQLLDDFRDINSRIMQICQHIGASCGYSTRAEYRYQAWVNINAPGAFNQPHIHPNCQLSGVYYITAPENSGSIYFRDPRVLSLMAPAPQERKSDITATEAALPPEAGRIYVFPAWLEHGVQQNRSAEERIGISFNMQVVPSPGSGQ